MTGDHRTQVETLRAQLMEWKRGIRSEALFWDTWMRERGGRWAEQFRRRFDPDTPLEPYIAAAARNMEEPDLRMLDVGSGPTPSTGYKMKEKTLQITAVDPLAPIYNDLLARHGLRPPISTTFAPVEELSTFFEAGSFDIVHCRNALDHSFDPLRGISEMLKVVRTNGVIVLRHHRNEAEHGQYNGFHHYNFDCRDDRFIVWNKVLLIDVADYLDGQACVSCALPGYVEVTIRKISNSPEPAIQDTRRAEQYLQAFVEIAAQEG